MWRQRAEQYYSRMQWYWVVLALQRCRRRRRNQASLVIGKGRLRLSSRSPSIHLKLLPLEAEEEGASFSHYPGFSLPLPIIIQSCAESLSLCVRVCARVCLWFSVLVLVGVCECKCALHVLCMLSNEIKVVRILNLILRSYVFTTQIDWTYLILW